MQQRLMSRVLQASNGSERGPGRAGTARQLCKLHSFIRAEAGTSAPYATHALLALVLFYWNRLIIITGTVKGAVASHRSRVLRLLATATPFHANDR